MLPLDYYSILSIPRSATASDLRAAYRTAALAARPTNNNDTIASTQFKLVSEAFDVLQNPQHRALYDQFGEKGLKDGILLGDGTRTAPYKFTSDPETLFLQQFGHSSPFYEEFSAPAINALKGIHEPILGNQPKKEKTSPQELNLYLTLEEFYTEGIMKKVKFTRHRYDSLHSTPEKPIFLVEERFLSVEIGRGWKNGTKLTFPGEGNDEIGKLTGDIIILIHELVHPLYTREGSNLIYHTRISLLESLTGVYRNIPLLDQREYLLKLDDIISPRYEKSIPHEGFPKKSPGERGNLIIRFTIDFPEELSLEQKNTLKRLL